jgi:hypothetical protein
VGNPWCRCERFCGGTDLGTLDEAIGLLYGVSFLVVWLVALGVWALRVFRNYLRDDRRIAQ